MDNHLPLPPELEPFQQQIYATQRAVVRILPKPAGPTQPWQSKVGGTPYLPKDTAFPVSPEGRHLFFLAQINFAEAPPLPPFPQQGILQFYISDDDFWGLNLDDPADQSRFRVLYFSEPTTDATKLVTDFSFLPAYNDLPLLLGKSFPIAFQPDVELMPAHDYRFHALFGDGFFEQFGDQEWEMYEEYMSLVFSEGHKFGGYPDFSQEDPRDPNDPMELLFQLDSDDDIDCMWGDTGIANFFIRPADLAARDFSKVWYNWDSC